MRRNFTYSDMDEWLNENRVTEIECLAPDLTGVARGKILPRTKFTEERGMRMPEAVLGMTVTGNYPTGDAAYERAISATDRDMVLRADPATAKIPVIAVTASVMQQDRKLIIEAGFDGYLGKPINLVEFLAAVNAMLARPVP